jgi:hypothetical protein
MKNRDLLYGLGTLALLAFVALVPTAHAEDDYEETVTLSSASAVSTTKKYLVQSAFKCNGEVSVKSCTTTTCTAEGGVAQAGIDSTYGTAAAAWDYCLLQKSGSNGVYMNFVRTGSVEVVCRVYRVKPITICK